MLIATTFRRPNAPIDLGERVYYFKPADPANPNSEHVAEVHDDDLTALLKIENGDGTPAYYIPKAKGTAPVSKPKPAEAPPPAAPQTGDGTPGQVSGDDAEIESAAAALINAHHKTFKAEVSKGGIPKPVLARALEIELAKPADDQRETILKQLREAIEAAG